MDIVDEDSAKSQRAIQSVEVGGKLLLVLSAHTKPMSLKDLAARAGLPPSRAHPYLVSYGRLGLVAQDAATGRYALGPAALQLGLTALRQCEPVAVADPVVEELALSTGQAVAVAVWGNFGPTITRMIDARQPLHVAMRAGTVMSMFGTATGRAFAGVQRRERIMDALNSAALGEERSQSAALVNDDLEAKLAAAREEIAAHGCTRAVGRPIPGVNAFSAPVFDYAREPVLVITALGHQDHVSSGWDSPVAQALRDAAATISSRLGFWPR